MKSKYPESEICKPKVKKEKKSYIIKYRTKGSKGKWKKCWNHYKTERDARTAIETLMKKQRINSKSYKVYGVLDQEYIFEKV